MSIENATLSGKAAGNDVATSWTIAISIRDEETVIVEYETVLGVTSTLVLDTDYTVTGITDSGFTLTLISFLLATGEYLHVRSEEEFTQEIPLPAGSTYSSDTHEAAFDKLTRLCQQLKLTLTQCVKLSLSRIGDSTDLEIDEDLVADAYLKVNAGATGLQQVTGVLPDDVTVTPYMETILDAVSAAAARSLLGVQTVFGDSGIGRLSSAYAYISSVSESNFHVFHASDVTPDETHVTSAVEHLGLDEVDADADWVDISVAVSYAVTSGAGSSGTNYWSLYARGNGYSAAFDPVTRVARLTERPAADAIDIDEIFRVRVPCVNKCIDFGWVCDASGTPVHHTASIIILGYGRNYS